jgi:hypothetical protein
MVRTLNQNPAPETRNPNRRHETRNPNPQHEALLGCRAGPEADRSDLLQHLRGVVHFGYAIELEGPAHFLEVHPPYKPDFSSPKLITLIP